MQFHFSSRTNLLEKKGVSQQENTELQIGPQLFFEEVASNITPLIAEEEGINKEGCKICKIIKRGGANKHGQSVKVVKSQNKIYGEGGILKDIYKHGGGNLCK